MQVASARTANVIATALAGHPAAAAVLEVLGASAARPEAPLFRVAYASVSRRLGRATQDGLADLPAELASLARPHWRLADWTRVWLLLLALETAPPDTHADLVRQLFEGGELGEQESLLRTLGLLPEPRRFREVALLACRTNALRLFEAIACENPYPVNHLAEPELNQMVLKAVFMEVDVRRIEGLPRRCTPELARMAIAYRDERVAAGRPVPPAIAFILQSAGLVPTVENPEAPKPTEPTGGGVT